MKNKTIFIILLSIMMLIPIKSKAASVSVALSCPTSANSGATIDCTVNVTSDVLVTGLSSNYTLSNMTYVSFTPDNGFATYASSASGFVVGNTEGKKGTFSIGTIKVTLNSTGSLKLRNLDASDVSFNSYTIADKTASVRTKSTNTNLKSLSLSTGTLSPSFSASTTSYTATVNAASVTINATKDDSYQTITGTGTKTLDFGTNTFNVVVKSETGATKTYKITITRPKSTNTNLKSLSLSTGTLSPSFSASTTNYTATVSAASVTINATKDDSYQTITGTGTKTLNYGTNSFNIVVKSQSGTTKTYKIVITRPDNRSTNTDLKSLSLSTGTLSPSFSASTTSYTATVNAASVTINATKADNTQTITGTGTKTLNYGTNTFNVVVKSEKGTTKTYTLIITRPENTQNNNKSTNTNLKSLSLSTGTISFNKNTTSYNINVEANISSIKINATLEDQKSSFVNGYGPRTINLNYGKNTAEIKVKSESGSIKTYTININRKDNRSSNNYLKSLTVSKGKILFSKEVLQYNLSVANDVTKIDVFATAEDNKSKVIINNPYLNIGNNTITINVTSENGKTRTYKINVKRLAKEEKMSDNNNIKSIKISGYDLKFRSDALEYDLTIKKEYYLSMDVVLEDESASYIIAGNRSLKDGSVIVITTTSESGIEKEYKINIKIKDNTNQILEMIGFGIMAIIIILIIICIIKYFRKNKKSYEPDNQGSMNYYNNDVNIGTNTNSNNYYGIDNNM